MMSDRPASTIRVPITFIQEDHKKQRSDTLATEEPMEIRVVAWQEGRPVPHRIAVTMRTPGHDFDLAAGFLFAEGVIESRQFIARISFCTDPQEPQQYNVVNVYLREDVFFDPGRLSRHVYTTSSCGICGKAALEQIRTLCSPLPVGTLRLPYEYWRALPDTLRQAQSLFSRTGGLHACGLFDAGGRLLLVREDIGRHNALDKLVGALLLEGRLPAADTVVLVSGRASFELVQKAIMAGIPVLAAIGAPSSLAVQLAQASGMTLIGFLREGRFNIYSGDERIEVPSHPSERDP